MGEAIYRLYRAAGLPERGWHNLRHAFEIHAAMFGVNPWKLMLWMGHERIDETMLYVHFAEAHLRPLPEVLVQALSPPASEGTISTGITGYQGTTRITGYQGTT